MHAAAIARIAALIESHAVALRTAAAESIAEHREVAERIVDSLWEDLDALEAALLLDPHEWIHQGAVVTGEPGRAGGAGRPQSFSRAP